MMCCVVVFVLWWLVIVLRCAVSRVEFMPFFASESKNKKKISSQTGFDCYLLSEMHVYRMKIKLQPAKYVFIHSHSYIFLHL